MLTTDEIFELCGKNNKPKESFMTDKEMLELAAKALGFDYLQNREWNPLKSKADCLQMEIDLNLDIKPYDGKWLIMAFDIKSGMKITQAMHQDRQRASTMAAAELGKTL